MAIALAVLSLAGITYIVLGCMGLLGKLPPNSFAGIRTRTTRASDAAWYAAHRASAPLFIFGGVAIASAGLAFLPFSLTGNVPDGLALSVTIALAVVALLTALVGARTGTKAARSASP